MDKYSIMEISKSYNKQFDCCIIRDNYNQDKLLFAHNESGKWEITNYKNVNQIEYSNAINYIKENMI